MRKHLILFTGLMAALASFSQDEPGCFEKCSHASMASRPEQVAYFQYPSMEKYDINFLKLDLTIEPNNRNIAGSALIRASVRQPMDSFICELRGNMTIDSLFINGVKITNYTRAADHVFVPLTPVAAAGSTISALFYYQGLASTAGVFAGTNTTNGLQYTASLSESYQAREWFPAKQLLKDKIDSAESWITTSNPNLAGSNGLLVDIIDLPGGKRQFRWKTRYPMAYYLISFAVGNYMDYRNYAKPVAISPDSILVQHYIVNNNTYFNSNKANLDKTPAFIEKLSELYGLYPFYQEKYGHAHAGIGGGMEHQTMSTMNSFGLGLIGHELGHQWFGDNVTCASWNHIWINEGFASYSEYLLIEKLPAFFTATTASNHMLSVHNSVLSAVGGSVHVPDASVYDENRIFNFRLTYNKGSAIIHNLRFEMQDDNLFFQALKNFQQQFKDSVATAEDFRLIAEQVSGKSFTDFFNQWYYGEGYPTFNVDYSREGDSLILRVNQTVSVPAVTPLFKGLYEFTINTAQGDTTVKVYMSSNEQVFKFRSNRTPTGVVVDPNNWVLNKVGSITTGINDPVNVSNEVKIYPNPSSGIFQLQYPLNWFETIHIFDASGRLMKQFTINRGTSTFILETGLQTGLYFIQLTGRGKRAVQKLVISK
ncbi:MAG TPA: M1 family aminopeptidase [Chitinophagaceae bacterium]|nr:M1 family aminopeptidase [Chitinophagaceae bacterium]